jgi:hypothetical protein
MSESRKPRRPSAAAMISLGGHHRIDPAILRSRVQERDQREASDTRTEAQRWLGDPPPSRSALRKNLLPPPVR